MMSPPGINAEHLTPGWLMEMGPAARGSTLAQLRLRLLLPICQATTISTLSLMRPTTCYGERQTAAPFLSTAAQTATGLELLRPMTTRFGGRTSETAPCWQLGASPLRL